MLVTQKSSQVLSAKNMKGFEKGGREFGVKKNQWRHENCSAAIIAFLTLQLFLRVFFRRGPVAVSGERGCDRFFSEVRALPVKGFHLRSLDSFLQAGNSALEKGHRIKSLLWTPCRMPRSSKAPWQSLSKKVFDPTLLVVLPWNTKAKKTLHFTLLSSGKFHDLNLLKQHQTFPTVLPYSHWMN